MSKYHIDGNHMSWFNCVLTFRRFSAIVFYLPLYKFREKNEFENFCMLILMPYLSRTFESYQRVKIYTYSVNDLGLKKFLQLYGIYGHFTVCR